VRDVNPPTVVAVAIGALREVGVDAEYVEWKDIVYVPSNTPTPVVLKALALAWVAKGEPLHEMACAEHGGDVANQPLCRRRTAAEIVRDPEGSCGA
jgi:hypothetical protein